MQAPIPRCSDMNTVVLYLYFIAARSSSVSKHFEFILPRKSLGKLHIQINIVCIINLIILVNDYVSIFITNIILNLNMYHSHRFQALECMVVVHSVGFVAGEYVGVPEGFMKHLGIK